LDQPPSGASDCSDADTDTPPVMEEGPILCASCDAPITERGALFQMNETGQVFANPHGHVFDIVTARDAQGVLPIGATTTEFTWFPGYAWRVLICASCGSHLGWQYDGPGRSPTTFFGFLKGELRGMPP